MSAPGTPTGDASGALAALVARLRDAGIPPGVEELADALWLARWLPGTPDRPASPDSTAGGPTSGPADAPGSRPARPHSVPAAEDAPAEQPDGARLFAPGEGSDTPGGRMAPVHVPAAPVLPEPLSLQRGLRPLQRYRAPVRPVPRVLDEQATAERAAESGLVLPVMRTERRREARLLLLMDVSTSTVVWQQALDELRQVCERAGAFREVQVQYLHEAPGGLPGYASAAEHPGPLHAPEQLSDPTGRRLTLVLSDCAGPMWRSGRMHRLLHGWAATAPVAVVQPLPQRMWLRTHLPARRGLLHRREGPAGALEFLPERGRAQQGALPVPVLALRRPSVEGWARLVSGATGQALAAAAGWVRADQPASGAPVRATEDISGAERVGVFWRTASPEARRLAVYLSAVPLYLPVMQLVQHAMLAGSGPDVLSEVLLSGLLKRRQDADEPRAVRYDFLSGVATELRTRLAVEDVELLLKHCSAYVERKFGRSARNFPALARAFLRGAVDPTAAASPAVGLGEEQEPAGLRAFAEVSADVLRDLGTRIPVVTTTPPELTAGDLLGNGREAIERYGREGLTRELDAAVGYLRLAAGIAGSGEERAAAGEELANALLARWRVRGVGEDLRDAWEAIAESESGSARGRLLRGLICGEIAGQVSARGIEFEGVPGSLREWARGAAHPRHPVEDYALAVALDVADRELEAVRAEELDERPGTGLPAVGQMLMRVRRSIAESGVRAAGPDGPFRAAVDPEKWYVAHMERAAEAGSRLVRPSGPALPLVALGHLWLDLARQHAGSGFVRPAVRRAELAALAAARAAEAFRAAVSDEDTLPAEERCKAWLALADAVEYQGRDADGHPTTREALEQALAAAGDNALLRLECMLRSARLHLRAYGETRVPAERDRAIDAWAGAELLLGEDHPLRASVLTNFGLTLLKRAETEGSVADTHHAIRVLRTAVEESRDEAYLPVQRMTLGRAHVQRFAFEGVLADLHEADWILGEAIRDSEDPEVLASCWNTRGEVFRHLGHRTGTPAHLHRAVECFTHVIGLARDLGDDAMAAEALIGRARTREDLGRVTAARADYEEARRLDPRAATRLDPETAPE
ncbi:SAV_2336 N-terminal domain-related protein [Streptomyces sp. GESEQ-35]|uniref:SAV_2336 N-terminal domain-related protein n=1 Tax=Streptomyces sp. GESEQ-35 TaxID=2812657 RepID=UPI001B321627|nr:SAV_2336 N-terminal domain-related protein [Streptomyces sp. GESEQ-35]